MPLSGRPEVTRWDHTGHTCHLRVTSESVGKATQPQSIDPAVIVGKRNKVVLCMTHPDIACERQPRAMFRIYRNRESFPTMRRKTSEVRSSSDPSNQENLECREVEFTNTRQTMTCQFGPPFCSHDDSEWVDLSARGRRPQPEMSVIGCLKLFIYCLSEGLMSGMPLIIGISQCPRGTPSRRTQIRAARSEAAGARNTGDIPIPRESSI